MRLVVTVEDRPAFLNHVFGADDILHNWPELLVSDGVTIERDANGMYYILDEGMNPVNDTAFFSGEELKYLVFDEGIRFKSFAEWPQGTTSRLDDDITSDSHLSYKHAISVCGMLERDGFGGEGNIKPLNTWIEPIDIL